MYLWLHVSTKNFDFCVSMFLCTQGYVLWCATHLPLCSTKGAVEISLLQQKTIVPPVQMQKEELSSASVLSVVSSIVKCVCMWVLGSAQDARANTRHEKRTYFEGLNCLKKALLSKILHCSKCPIQVVSLQLLSKLGSRQYFQKVSSREIVQSTKVK